MLASRVFRSAAAAGRTSMFARPMAARRIPHPTISPWIRGMAKDNKPRPFPGSQSTGPRPGNGGVKAASSPGFPKPQAPQPPPSASASQPKSEPPLAEAPEQPDLSKLPDLTRGIPSTIEYETTGATKPEDLTALKELSAGEDESHSATGAAGGAGGSGRGKGELPASAYISSQQKRQQRLASRLFGLFIILSVGGTCYLGRNWDDEMEAARYPDAPNGWGIGLWWNRVRARTGDFLTYYHEPAFDKLLPDPDPLFERPYTLCISLEDMLVHSEWTREHGWRVAKRPGADYFLRYLSQYYELVIFTSVPWAMGDPLVRKLDPFRIVMWNLYREATKYKDGEIVKDLSYLNRDLSKVIMIDTKASHVRAQPENAILLAPWKGDAKNKDLVALIPFLEFIHTMQYGDVRDVLRSFSGTDIPVEFARREAIARAEFEKQRLASSRPSSQKKKHASGVGMLGSLLGLKPSNMSMVVVPEGEQNPSEAFAQGKMLQDLARERGQRNYEMLEKEIRENGEKWLKEEQALQEKAQQEAVTSMKSSFAGWFLPPSSATPGGAAPPTSESDKLKPTETPTEPSNAK